MSGEATGFELLRGKRVLLRGHGALLRALSALNLRRQLGLELVAEGDADALLLAPRLDADAPLDEALELCVHATEEAIAWAREHDAPVLLASGLDALGERKGALFEGDPARPPFPRARERGDKHWELDKEIASAAAVVEETRSRARHADRLARAEADARDSLERDKDPTRGLPLVEETEAVLEKDRTDDLVGAGRQRARGWGWTSVRGYALALAEQLLARSGVPFTIVRLAPAGEPLESESADAHDDGEGSAAHWSGPQPLLADWVSAAREGFVRPPRSADARVEILPADLAAGALVIALATLWSGRAPSVQHASLGAEHPLSAGRLGDLIDLHTRPHRRVTEGAPTERIKRFSKLLRRAAEAPRAKVSADLLLLDEDQRLRGRHLGQAERRLFGDDAGLFATADLDWRRYFLDRHLPAVDAAVERLRLEAKRATRPLRPYPNLLALLEEGARRYKSRPALSYYAGEERSDVSYKELLARARAVARRLEEAGVAMGDRVILSGENHPDWAIAAFGIVAAGAVCVPLDPTLAPEQAENILAKSGAKLAILDDKSRKEFGDEVFETSWDLHLSCVSGPAGGIEADDVDSDALASILFTSGTTGDPKGVMLSHKNFASLIASLARVFDVHGNDRLLSVLPLHHTFEYSCGLLLPLSAGCQISYLDELKGERLLYALREGRITAMVGVPALWQLLERRIRKQVEERGGAVKALFDLSLRVNEKIGQRFGVDAGRFLFKSVHDELGGHLRTIISGGAALPSEVQDLFGGLGLPLAEGYGLTEAAPVLTVAEPDRDARGTVGRPVPGVEVRIDKADDKGVGEVIARGPNVMQGYFGDEEATRAVLTEDGWLRTGDLGRIDDDGRLQLVGRAKDVVVTAAGENIYLDDVEARLVGIAGVEELTLVGLDDARGGERLALSWVAAEGADLEAAEGALEDALIKLPAVFRPSFKRRWHEEALPRTATRKVKRRLVKTWLEEQVSAQSATTEETPASPPFVAVRQAVAGVVGAELSDIAPGTSLAGDLGFDSLMWVERPSCAPRRRTRPARRARRAWRRRATRPTASRCPPSRRCPRAA
jgi:long-chain acyl-CoA synthetase